MSIVRTLGFVWLLVGTVLDPAGALAQDAPDPARRAWIASRIHTAIRTHFAHWDDVPDLDLDAAYRAYLDEALTATDRRGFSLATSAFLARLGNGHTWFIDRRLDPDAGRRDAFSVRVLEGAWTIAESARDDLRRGDVITAIDGLPIEEVFAKIGPAIQASTERSARLRMFHPSRRWLLPLRFEMTLDDGRVVSVDRGADPQLPAPEVEGRWLVDDEVAYIRIPSWDGPRFQESAMDLLESFATAGAIVVDVRGNGGGTTPIAFITALMDRDWRWWKESTPIRLGIYSTYGERGRAGFTDFARPHMSWPASVQEGEGTFTGRLAILIDAGCRSACEDFVMPFKDNGRATLIGEATAGSTGQPYVEDLGDGMMFAVGAKREHFPDGARFEGVGVTPHHSVVPTPADLRTGRDPELDLSIEIVRSGS